MLSGSRPSEKITRTGAGSEDQALEIGQAGHIYHYVRMGEDLYLTS